MVPQPGDRLLCEVFAEVILLAVRRFDGIAVLEEPRLPLRCLAGKEAVEVIEAVSVGPAIEGPHRRGLIGGCIVPFANGG